MGKTVRVAFTGGGSGGHIYPLLAVYGELERKSQENSLSLDVRYFGERDEFSELFAARSIRRSYVPAGKIRRYLSFRNIIDVPKFFIGLVFALWKLYFFMPDVVFSKGGSGAFPVVLASWFYRIPVIIHESDASPGLTNLASSRFASAVAVGFENAAKYFNPSITAVTGNPVRAELLSNIVSKEAAREQLGFFPGEPMLLILGGSQGAQKINQFVLPVLKELLPMAQVLHQTGRFNFADTEDASRGALMDLSVEIESRHPYKPVAFLDRDYGAALAAADIVMSRAGAGSIFEIAAFGRAAILIPLDGSANDHQRLNAYDFAKKGGAIVIEEENLLPQIFINQVKQILASKSVQSKMEEGSRSFFKSGAAELLASEILRIALKK